MESATAVEMLTKAAESMIPVTKALEMLVIEADIKTSKQPTQMECKLRISAPTIPSLPLHIKGSKLGLTLKVLLPLMKALLTPAAHQPW